MTIVLDEKMWAEEMLAAKRLGKKPYETLCRIAKYYINECGFSKRETRQRIETYILQCDQSASIPKWSKTIDYALSNAMKRDLIKIDSIRISKDEMKTISSLEGKQLRRLAFTLLCLSKYWDRVNANSDHWVNNQDSEIMNMANINTSIKRQSGLYHQLNELGLIQFSKRIDNTNVRVMFSDDGVAEMEVYDFRNLGYQYLKFCGDKNYIQCQCCGKVVRKNTSSPEAFSQRGGIQKYCRSCASELKIKRAVDSVMRTE